MSQMLTALSAMFEEDLVSGFEDRMTEIDSVYAGLITSSENVEMDSITKNYSVIHTFITSLAGAIRAGSPLGPEMSGSTGHTQMIAAHDTYPGVADTPLPGIAQRRITIAKLRGTVPMTTAMLRAQHLHTVGNYPATVLQQTAKMLAHSAAVSWYLNDSAQVATLDLSGAGATISRVGAVVSMAAPTGESLFLTGRARRMLPGLQYDVWTTDMATCYTQNGWAMLSQNVDMFDSLAATFLFKSEVDAAAVQLAADPNLDGTPTVDLMLVPYSAIPNRAASGASASILPCGYQWWLRNSGYLFGAHGGSGAERLDVTTYGSLYKSYVPAAVGAALTETLLNQHMKKFEDATGVRLDTLIMTSGVMVSLQDSYGGDSVAGIKVTRFPREPGQSGKIAMGTTIMSYIYNGREMALHVSDFLNAKEVVGLKVGENNLIRYQPPTVDGTQGSVSGFDARIEWLGKLTGDTIWMNATAVGGGKTDGLEAPFDLLVQHAATEVRGMRLTTVTEL